MLHANAEAVTRNTAQTRRRRFAITRTDFTIWCCQIPFHHADASHELGQSALSSKSLCCTLDSLHYGSSHQALRRTHEIRSQVTHPVYLLLACISLIYTTSLRSTAYSIRASTARRRASTMEPRQRATEARKFSLQASGVTRWTDEAVACGGAHLRLLTWHHRSTQR